MKNFWKVLGLAALAAAVPVRIKKDETTGKKQYQSLLLSVDVGPGENGEGTDIGVNLGEGVINSAIMGAVNARREASLFTDDPMEAAVFTEEDIPAAAAEDAAEEENTGESESAANEESVGTAETVAEKETAEDGAVTSATNGDSEPAL